MRQSRATSFALWVRCSRGNPAKSIPEDVKGHTAVNPVLLVEVLSPTTEDYDRGEKLSHYKHISTLQEVMLVALAEHRVDLWRRVDERWTQLSFRDGERVELQSVSARLAVDEVYRDPFAT